VRLPFSFGSLHAPPAGDIPFEKPAKILPGNPDLCADSPEGSNQATNDLDIDHIEYETGIVTLR
jgi:hypothetical protein